MSSLPKNPQQDRRPIPTFQRRSTPLTHHDIMRLVGPFSERGWRVDLARSDRERRRLLFVPAAPERHADLTVTLRLEVPIGGHQRLTRIAQQDGEREATLVVEGGSPRRMLETMDRLDVGHQLRRLGDITLSLNYHLDLSTRPATRPWPFRRETRAAQPRLPTLIEARAQGPELALQLQREGRSVVYGLRLELFDDDAQRRAVLPQDLFCVLGGEWRPLDRERGHWTGGLRPPMQEPERSAAVEAALLRGIRHCREVLVGTPADFHRRFERARYRAALRRVTPLLIAVAGAGALVSTALALPKSPLSWMMLSQVPFLVILLVSLLGETPRLEIPPLPGVSRAGRWSTRQRVDAAHDG